MSILGEQLSAPAPTDHDVEQVLLGLADGSYVLSTPDGAVAECGVGVVALLGASAEQLAGRPVTDVLAAATDPAQRAAFERLLHGERDDTRQAFATTTAGGAPRSLRFVVVSVPLELGWEFTSLLGELRSRDADTWHPEALRLRHERALEAVERVCVTGAQPEPGARLAGILIVVRDAAAPPLTREDVGQRMAAQRIAVRDAKEAERRAAAGLSDAPSTDGPGLEDLVERAHMLRERVGEAEQEAAAAYAERERALTRLAAIEAERDERHGALLAQVAALQAERERATTQLAAVHAEHERATAQLAGEVAERERVLALLDAERAQAQARLEAVAAERDAEAQRRQDAEARVTATLETGDGRIEQLAGELRDAHVATAAAQAQAQAARAAAAEARAQAGLADAAVAQACTEAQAARGEHALARGELAAMRGELECTRSALEGVRVELHGARSEPSASPAELEAAHVQLGAVRNELEARTRELESMRDELGAQRTELDGVRADLEVARATGEDLRAELEQARMRAGELLEDADRARAAVEAIRAEFAFELPPPATPAGSPPSGPRTPFVAPPSPQPTAAEAQQTAGPAAAVGEPPPCEPGFAAALIGLDGTFIRLDDAFCSLLGCREDELRKARWPSIIDRENLAEHQEIARALRAGEIESADVETIYMHKGGLLVPVEGTVTMHRDARGQATHFLFRADVRRTSGAASGR